MLVSSTTDRVVRKVFSNRALALLQPHRDRKLALLFIDSISIQFPPSKEFSP